MTWSIDDIRRLGVELLGKAVEINTELAETGSIEIPDTASDVVLHADIAISETVRRELTAKKFPAILYTEELDPCPIRLTDGPVYTLAFDDIDGTANKRDSLGEFPHCSILTIFEGTQPKYRDAIYAGVISHTSRNLYEAVRGRGCFLNDEPVRMNPIKVLDKNCVVYIDHEMLSRGPEEEATTGLEKLDKLKKAAWTKDMGSSGIVYAVVGTSGYHPDNKSAAYVAPVAKEHETGAGYLFTQEGGGVFVDLDGQPYHDRPYNFNGTISVIQAATSDLAEQIVAVLKR